MIAPAALMPSVASVSPLVRGAISVVLLALVGFFASKQEADWRQADTLAAHRAVDRGTSAHASPTGAASIVDPLPRLLLALAAVILVGRFFGWLLDGLGQPAVIGEVLAGIALGPTLLGAVGQAWLGTGDSPLLPEEIAPYLGVIAELGIVLYMFLVGIDFHAGEFKQQAHAAAAVGLASLLVPFLAGVALAAALYARLAPGDASPAGFVLFFGVALSVTAFPVLARILADRGLADTRLGLLALSSAAIGDVAAWWLLALVAGIVQAKVSGVLHVVVLSLAYIATMLLVVRPLAARLIARSEQNGLSRSAIAAIFAALLFSAYTTERIGIHAVFGAFLLGVVIPHDSQIAQSLKRGLEQVVLVLLLPAFFAYTGMRTEIGLVSGWNNWLICGVIIFVATASKFGSAYVSARLAGIDGRTSSALGILMNTRGLMELIVLNIGLDLSIVSPTLFAMLVVMALVTTLATAPLLALVPGEVAAATFRRTRGAAA